MGVERSLTWPESRTGLMTVEPMRCLGEATYALLVVDDRSICQVNSSARGRRITDFSGTVVWDCKICI
jgi:hypothetical protein